MPTMSVEPPARKYLGRFQTRQRGKPACALPGCGRPAAFQCPSKRHAGVDPLEYCSQTCFQNHRWLLTLDKAR